MRLDASRRTGHVILLLILQHLSNLVTPNLKTGKEISVMGLRELPNQDNEFLMQVERDI
jgi:hypothetical protein